MSVISNILISQQEADNLISMNKYRKEIKLLNFPNPGSKIIVPLADKFKKEDFLLDIDRSGKIALKIKYQTRARKVIILVRLDMKGRPHENPDGKIIPLPHLHGYKEGWGNRWANFIPELKDVDDFDVSFNYFVKYCNIKEPLNINTAVLPLC